MPIVSIDGFKIEVKKNDTILDAAKKAGIWLPTLCYHPALAATGSCRICTVELDHGDRKQLVTACNYPVRQDIVVYVSSKRAQKARRGIMELLLARSPESKELKTLAEQMGVKETPYPKVTECQRNCILCGLCVQVCEEVIGRSAIGFAGRGPDRTIAAPFRQPSEDCIACGACAVVCPVGTITVRLHPDQQEVEISPFKSRVKLFACKNCGQPLAGNPVIEQAASRVAIDNDEFRELVQLCPKCRRLKTAAGLKTAGFPVKVK